jgi:hypothetical protein
MVDIATIKQIARFLKDENGESVVAIPLAIWEELLSEVETAQTVQRSQVEKFEAFLKKTENYQDDKSQEWWDDFNKFLRENRLHFPERNIDAGNE